MTAGPVKVGLVIAGSVKEGLSEASEGGVNAGTNSERRTPVFNFSGPSRNEK